MTGQPGTPSKDEQTGRQRAEAHRSTIRHLSGRRRTVATNFLRSDNVNKSRQAGRVAGRSTAEAVKRSCLANGTAAVDAGRSRLDRDNSWNYGELLFLRHELDPSVHPLAVSVTHCPVRDTIPDTPPAIRHDANVRD